MGARGASPSQALRGRHEGALKRKDEIAELIGVLFVLYVVVVVLIDLVQISY